MQIIPFCFSIYFDSAIYIPNILHSIVKIVESSTLRLWNSQDQFGKLWIGSNFTLSLIFLLLEVICLFLIKPVFYSAFMFITALPLLYLSFISHTNSNSSSIKSNLVQVLSIKSILLLPHTIIIIIVGIFLVSYFSFVGLFASIIIMNFFRIYSVEIIKYHQRTVKK